MVTGDHIQTALSVAKECKMIKVTNKLGFGQLVDDNRCPMVQSIGRVTSTLYYICSKFTGRKGLLLESF